MRLLALEKELVQAFHAVNGITPGQFIVESVSDQAEAVDRLVKVKILLKLEKQHIDKGIFSESSLEIERVQQAEQIVWGYQRADQAAQVDGAVRPGISAGEERGGAGGGEISSRMVVVIDGRAGSQPLQVRAGLTRVTVEREITGG